MVDVLDTVSPRLNQPEGRVVAYSLGYYFGACLASHSLSAYNPIVQKLLHDLSQKILLKLHTKKSDD